MKIKLESLCPRYWMQCNNDCNFYWRKWQAANKIVQTCNIMFVLLTNNFPFDESYSRSFNCFYPTQFRMTKCTFHKYGTSGNIENHDVLCILPLNIGKTRTLTNPCRQVRIMLQSMKRYTSSSGFGSWPWACSPSLWSSIGSSSSSVLTSELMCSGWGSGWSGTITASLPAAWPPDIYRRVKRECIDAIIGRSYVGDWLLFYLLGQNIDSGAYKVSVQCIH